MIIELVSKFFDNHSLSIVSRNLAIELDKLQKNNKFKLFITPLDIYDSRHQISKEHAKILGRLAKDRDNIADIQIRHSYPPIWRWPLHYKTKILYVQPWEFSRVPSEWMYKFEQFADALITPSHWSADRYLESGINPERMHVIPNGYNPDIFNIETEPKNSNAPLNFIYVGNAQHRKGVDILLRAWCKTFKKTDRVKLTIKDTPDIYGPSNLIDEILKIQYKLNCGKIVYNDNNISTEEMAKLYKSNDILIHPYRGEGFAMHVQEAVACGCIPLVSAEGPTSDFIPDNAFDKISITKQITDLSSSQIFAMKPGDSLSMMGSHGWINEPNEEDLSLKMKAMYDNQNGYRSKLNEGFDKVKLHTWAEVAKGYLEACDLYYTLRQKQPIRYHYDLSHIFEEKNDGK